MPPGEARPGAFARPPVRAADPSDQLRVAAVCRRFHRVVHTDRLWLALVRRTWGALPPDLLCVAPPLLLPSSRWPPGV